MAAPQVDVALPCVYGICRFQGTPTLACTICNKHVTDAQHFNSASHVRYATYAANAPASRDAVRYYEETLNRNWTHAQRATLRHVSVAEATAYLTTGVMPPVGPPPQALAEKVSIPVTVHPLEHGQHLSFDFTLMSGESLGVFPGGFELKDLKTRIIAKLKTADVDLKFIDTAGAEQELLENATLAACFGHLFRTAASSSTSARQASGRAIYTPPPPRPFLHFF